MNSVTMIGRLTKEPELRRTQSGTACCSFSLAVKRPHVKDTTDFHDCVVWQQGAEFLSQYGHKGDLVAVTGYLTTRGWQDNDGNKRKAIEVTCDNVELLSSKSKSEERSNTTTTQNPSYAQPGYPTPNAYAQPAQSYAQPTYQQQQFTPLPSPDMNLPF